MNPSADLGVEVTIDESMSKITNKNNKRELNLLDKLITIDNTKLKDLTNDVHDLNELRVSQSKRKKDNGVAAVTPITTMNIRKGKKGRRPKSPIGLGVVSLYRRQKTCQKRHSG